MTALADPGNGALLVQHAPQTLLKLCLVGAGNVAVPPRGDAIEVGPHARIDRVQLVVRVSEWAGP